MRITGVSIRYCLLMACCLGGEAMAATFHVPLFVSASHHAQQSLMRIINHSDRSGTVSIRAIDDSGRAFPPRDRSPMQVALGSGRVVHFNSADLERGNPDKVPGLGMGIGGGVGDWRLVLMSELDIEPLVYLRTHDGFMTSMHDMVSVADGQYEVAVFNLGRRWNQVSRLRMVNPGAADVEIEITSLSDAAGLPGDVPVSMVIPAGEVREVTAARLQAGRSSFSGRLAQPSPGSGNWRLLISANGEIHVMNLLESLAGHLTNLSTRPYRKHGASLEVAQTKAPEKAPEMRRPQPCLSDPSWRTGLCAG